MTIYQHRQNGKQLELVKIEGNTAFLRTLGDAPEEIKLPKVALLKWYQEVKSEEAPVSEAKKEEAIQEVVQEVKSDDAQLSNEAISEKQEDVSVAEETISLPESGDVTKDVEATLEEAHTEPAVEQKEVHSKNTKEASPKAAQPRKAKSNSIPSDTKCVELVVNGFDVKFYEYMATDVTFKTEAVIEINEDTYRFGSVFKTSTNKAFSSFYFKNDSSSEISEVQRKGIAAAAKFLANYINKDDENLEANLAEIMTKSRDLELYK